jgi:hypothetical protein
VNDKISVVQFNLDSKSCGFRAFFIDVACFIGLRVGALERMSGTTCLTVLNLFNSNQDPKVKSHLCKLETQIEGTD